MWSNRPKPGEGLGVLGPNAPVRPDAKCVGLLKPDKGRVMFGVRTYPRCRLSALRARNFILPQAERSPQTDRSGEICLAVLETLRLPMRSVARVCSRVDEWISETAKSQGECSGRRAAAG